MDKEKYMKKAASNFMITEMNQDEVQDIVIQWAKNEGWNPGLDDSRSFYAQNRHGFFAGRLNGEIIGCCSAVIYDETFAFFGFYIVQAEYRHQGYGIQMTHHCLQYAEDRNIGLDGVLDMACKYENIGFNQAHMNIRYTGQLIFNEKRDKHEEEIIESLLPKIEQYDRCYFPAPRRPFLKEWLKPSLNQLSLVYIDEEGIKGYGTIRRCYTGYKIGPLFAESEEVAEKLFRSLILESKGESFYLDIPEPNKGALKLVERYQMKECFKTIRMYTKNAPDINLDNVFGITTFEFG